MRSFACLIVALLMSSLVTPLHAGKLPKGGVCVQMQEAGDRLLAGNSKDFFFIEAAGIQFPVPSFFLIRSPAQSVSEEIRIKSLPSIATSRPSQIRQSKNWCNWQMKANIGTRERMYEMNGGEEKFKRNIEELYQAGQLKAALLKKPVGYKTETRNVIAWNDQGFIMFFTDQPERVFWLIQLAEELNDSK